MQIASAILSQVVKPFFILILINKTIPNATIDNIDVMLYENISTMSFINDIIINFN
jgi:hypothetical protein